MRTTKLAVLSLAIAAAQAHAFDIKGVRLGDPMTECPPGSVVVPGSNPSTLCSFGPSTVANQPASDYVISFYEGKVTSLMYQLQDKGRSANGGLRDSLIAKFGTPSSSKSHINEYRWTKPGQILALDGFRGTLILLDVVAHQKSRDEAAKSNKGDL